MGEKFKKIYFTYSTDENKVSGQIAALIVLQAWDLYIYIYFQGTSIVC